MGLKRIKEIELISERDEAVESLIPLTFKEGVDPFVFVFKNQTDLDTRDDYLLRLTKLQKTLSKNNQSEIEKLPAEEQVNLMKEMFDGQFEIVKYLLIGYRERINGNLIPKDEEILQIMRDNDVIPEFFSKLVNKKENNDKKKS